MFQWSPKGGHHHGPRQTARSTQRATLAALDPTLEEQRFIGSSFLCPPPLSGRGVRESCRSVRKAVHYSPPSSEANLRWQNRSHITRRTEEGLTRGAL